MKTIFAVIAVCLVLCEGRISDYRRSKSRRHRNFEEDSYEEDYGDLSLEEEEDSAPRYERKMRASIYQPSYGYSKSYKRKYDREDGVKLRKPKYTDERNRGKYMTYEKTPHKTYKKDIASKQQSFTPEVGERKKDNRAAPVYEPMYHYPSPPPPPPPASYASRPSSVPYRKPVPYKAPCNQQLLISCTPTVTKVCSADFGGHYPVPQHVPDPPHFEVPAHHAPEADYSPPAYHHAPEAGYSPPAYQHAPEPVYTPPVHHQAPEPAYHPPASQYLPPTKPSYHHQLVQSEPVHRPLYQKPGQHPYYQSKPGPHFPVAPAYHQPYQPTYKSNDQSPAFAAPVNEDNQEPAIKQPFISAFRTTSTSTTSTTQRVPIAPADKEQNFPKAENHSHRPQNGGEEAQNAREASGDEPEPGVVAVQGTTSSSTTTAAPKPSSNPLKDIDEGEDDER